MITMTTYSVYEYMKEKFPDIESILKNGNIDNNAKKSIGIFLGSDTRSTGNLAIGGIDCTVVRMLPINIKIRWTDNQKECDEQATKMYNSLLLEKQNFMSNNIKIAYIELLDGSPVSLGRDNKNICESMIRANFYYYIQEVEQ